MNGLQMFTIEHPIKIDGLVIFEVPRPISGNLRMDQMISRARRWFTVSFHLGLDDLALPTWTRKVSKCR